MEIIEKLLIGKNEDPALCEDGLFISENFIAVIDGVTAKTPVLLNGKTGGRLAMEVLSKALENLDKNVSCEEAFLTLNSQVAEILDKAPDIRAAAQAIIFSKTKNEIWCCGDCQCIINDELYLNEKELDTITSKMRSLILQTEVLNGKTEAELLENDVGRQFISSVLKSQYLLENAYAQYGYEVLNGKDLRTDLIKRYPVKNGDTIILASDGYPKLKASLEDSENALKEVLEKDPLCYKIFLSTKGIQKGNKSFDDRAYIKFIV